MKTLNSLEDQMRSWTPRRPAARLEEKLFGAQNPIPENRNPERTITLPWHRTLGASLAGCTVLLLTVFNFTHFSVIQSYSQPFGPLSNHPSALALASAPINTWSAPILHWTNHGEVGSPIQPFDLLNTNRHLH